MIILKKQINNVSISRRTPNDKIKVSINGNLIHRNKRITLCGVCTKINGCNHDPSIRLCTSAGYFYDMKKKYKYKVFGKYRFKKWVSTETKRGIRL